MRLYSHNEYKNYKSLFEILKENAKRLYYVKWRENCKQNI